MTNQCTQDITTLYKRYYKMLWYFSHKYNVDIAVCEIAFMQCVEKFNGKSSFSTYLWLALKHECWKECRKHKALKRQTENHICDYNIDWVGVIPHQSIWTLAKKVLMPNDYDLLYKIFAMGYSQTELAIVYNTSQVQLSRRIRKITNKLRSSLYE